MFIGHTRFSLFTPGTNTWKSSRQSITDEDYTSYLYDLERLEFRRKVFLEVSLPILARAAQGYRFRHVVSFSSNLPMQYKEALHEASREYDFLVLNELPPKTPATKWFQLVADEIYVGEVFATYRLDDDDLLGLSYFTRLAPYLNDSFVGMLVSLGRGVTAVWDGEKFRRPSIVHKPLLAIGLAEIHKRLGSSEFASPAPAGGSHMNADLGNAVVIDSRGLDFVWTRSDSQDTLFRQDARLRRIAESNSELEVATLKDLETEFPTLLPMVEYPNIAQLVNQPLVVDDRNWFPFTEWRQGFAVEIVYTAESGVSNDAYLISFDVRDPSGSRVTALRARGVSRSRNSEIGFFREAKFTQGKRTLRFSLALPEDVLCAGITVIKQESNAGRVTLQEVNVHDL